MLHFNFIGDELVSVTESWLPDNYDAVEDRNHFPDFQYAENLAAEATKVTGHLHIAVDQGAWTSPQFDVIEAPVIGDKVSRAFNGDYYPAGTIVRISKTLKKITTSDGTKFYRRRQSGAWVEPPGWSMVQGHISRWNPEF